MVLKIVKRALVSQPDLKMGVIQVDRFFDGFHNIVVELKSREAVDYLPTQYSFTRESGEAQDETLKQITLIGNNSAEHIHVDSSYEVYLLSDTGKTIERIN
jgi:hypothetical protein